MEVKIVGGQAEGRHRAAFIPDKFVEDGEYGLVGECCEAFHHELGQVRQFILSGSGQNTDRRFNGRDGFRFNFRVTAGNQNRGVRPGTDEQTNKASGFLLGFSGYRAGVYHAQKRFIRG